VALDGELALERTDHRYVLLYQAQADPSGGYNTVLSSVFACPLSFDHTRENRLSKYCHDHKANVLTQRQRGVHRSRRLESLEFRIEAYNSLKCGYSDDRLDEFVDYAKAVPNECSSLHSGGSFTGPTISMARDDSWTRRETIGIAPLATLRVRSRPTDDGELLIEVLYSPEVE
jgi:hypothetical protein